MWLAGTKVGRWIAGVGAVVVAMLGLFAVGWLKGRKHEAEADQAKDAAEQVEAVQAANDAANRSADAVRQTHEEVAKMPDIGTQRVADAAPDSAAGWLRANANRDQAGS
jgi:hypothetical protein